MLFYKNYPTKQRLQSLFEIRDGLLWRKTLPSVEIKPNQFITRHPRFVKSLPKKTHDKRSAGAGYAHVRIDSRLYLYHVIVWILEHGEIPDGYQIDHINGIRHDNRLENLRLVTTQQNCWNRPIHRSGRLPGATFYRGKWRARITLNGKRFSLGSYDTELEAHNSCMIFLEANKI